LYNILGVEIYGLEGTKLSNIDTIDLKHEFITPTDTNEPTETPKTDEVTQLNEDTENASHKILIEPVSNKEEGQNIVFIYQNKNMLMINFNQTEENTDGAYAISVLKLPNFGNIIKMKWLFATKLDKLFCVLVNAEGGIFLTQLDDFELKIVHCRSDLLTREILCTSIISISIDYMGKSRFKIIIYNSDMSLIEYNISVKLDKGKNTVQQVCEIHNVANMYDLPQKYIYK
jgi:hypothetical protein